MKKIILLAFLALILAGCQHMGPTEYGVRFRSLPPALGGGLSDKIIAPGQQVIVWPWDSIYKFDTSVKDVGWGGSTSRGDIRGDYVHTRAEDGNEVALAVKILYKVTTDPQRLMELVKYVGTSNEEIHDVVVAEGRSSIRTYMSELRTSQFADDRLRYSQVEKVRESLVKSLDKFGIDVVAVNLIGFRFERLLRDGTVDDSYQDKITDIQKLAEDTEREKSRAATVRAKKQQEFNTALAGVNRVTAEAEGYKRDAKLRGDAYAQSKFNEAQAILARGKGEVEGLMEQINALSGPGGSAILRLDIARALLANDPRFVVMGANQGGGAGNLEVRRTDANELLQQVGVFEALKEKERKPRAQAPEQQQQQQQQETQQQ